MTNHYGQKDQTNPLSSALNQMLKVLRSQMADIPAIRHTWPWSMWRTSVRLKNFMRSPRFQVLFYWFLMAATIFYCGEREVLKVDD